MTPSGPRPLPSQWGAPAGPLGKVELREAAQHRLWPRLLGGEVPPKGCAGCGVALTRLRTWRTGGSRRQEGCWVPAPSGPGVLPLLLLGLAGCPCPRHACRQRGLSRKVSAVPVGSGWLDSHPHRPPPWASALQSRRAAPWLQAATSLPQILHVSAHCRGCRYAWPQEFACG